MVIIAVKICFRLQGKSQIVQDELVRLGEQMVSSSEGTRALALELCREFEDKFLAHIIGGEVSIGVFDLQNIGKKKIALNDFCEQNI